MRNFGEITSANLTREGFDPLLAPKTYGLLEKVTVVPEGQSFVTANNFQVLRRKLGKAAESADKTERQAARIAQSSLDEFMPAITENLVLEGNLSKASGALEDARKNYAAASRSERLQEALSQAEKQAARSGFGGNLENSTRQRISSILNSPAKKRGFSQEEISELENYVKGNFTRNSVRTATKILGGDNPLMAAVHAGLAFPTHGLSLAAPITGYVLKRLNDAMSSRQLSRIDNIIRSRSPLAKQTQSAIQDWSQAGAGLHLSNTAENAAKFITSAQALNDVLGQSNIKANLGILSTPFVSQSSENEQPRTIPQITIHKEPPRATGGSVFDKMHAAKHMQKGGGTDAPFNEWDAVPRNAEGIPQIRIEKPPVNEADEAQAAREAAPTPAIPPQPETSPSLERDEQGNMVIVNKPYTPVGDTRKGIFKRMTESAKDAFGNEPPGISPENLKKYPYLNVLQPFAGMADVALRDINAAVAGGAGAVAGFAENIGMSEAEANRLQRDIYQSMQIAGTQVPTPTVGMMTKPVVRKGPKIAELAGDIVNPLAVTKGVALNPGEFALGSGPIKRAVLEQPNAPTFYSALDRAVSDIPQAKAPAEQWAATLANRPGVKPEEIQWRGLDQYLAGRQGQTVTKQEIADHLAGNKVELGEVTKGEFSSSELDAAAVKARETGNWAEYDRLLNQAKSNETSNTKYHSYQLPGGENYSEKLLTLPDNTQKMADLRGKMATELRQKYGYNFSDHWTDAEKQAYWDTSKNNNYKSPHWDEPNPVTHMRTNERTIGNTASHHIEEVQSDWHQKGRDKGYKMPPAEYQAMDARRAELERIGGELYSSGQETPAALKEEWVAIMNKLQPENTARVPDAPFKKTWPDLTMKQALRDAVENGKDRLSWTPGEAQAARYDLSKHYEGIEAARNPETGKYDIRFMPKGEKYFYDAAHSVPPEELPNHIGKDLANKIHGDLKDDKGNGKEWPRRSYEGLDLKVGGEGMNEFYDKMLPKAVEKLGKAYGVKVQRGVDTTGNPVNYVDIPPAWKQEILKKGFPLFASGGSVFDKMKRASK